MEARTMIILIDMDDTIETLIKGWVAYNNEKLGTDTRPEDVRDWRMELAFPGHTREEVYAAEKDDHLWDLVGPIDGAPKALQRLLDDGHEIYIVTATAYETLRAKMEKVLFRYFPFIDWEHVIVTSNKHLIHGDVLVDDGPHNLQGGDYAKILFTASHNLDFDEKAINAVRVKNWDEAYREICRIAKINKP